MRLFGLLLVVGLTGCLSETTPVDPIVVDDSVVDKGAAPYSQHYKDSGICFGFDKNYLGVIVHIPVNCTDAPVREEMEDIWSNPQDDIDQEIINTQYKESVRQSVK
jgi:hypothetical protein